MRRTFYISPIIQAIFGPALNIVTGVVCGVVGNQIFNNGDIVLAKAFEGSFWAAAAMLVPITGLFTYLSYRSDVDLEEELDQNRKRAQLRDHTAEALAEQMRNVIATGQQSGMVTQEHVMSVWGFKR